MLRLGDLKALTVSDIVDNMGNVKITFPWRQQKRKGGVYPVLTLKTRQFLDQWIKVSGKTAQDILFTSLRPGKAKDRLSDSGIQSRVKSWAQSLGLDPTNYSTHSMRRTKPIYLYGDGVRIEMISELLGHKDPKSTMYYLGLSQMEAQEVALTHDIFSSRRTHAPSRTSKTFSKQELAQLEKILQGFFDSSKTILDESQLHQLANKMASELVKPLAKEIIEGLSKKGILESVFVPETKRTKTND